MNIMSDDEIIKNIFYGEVVPECNNSKLDIEGWPAAIAFKTYVYGCNKDEVIDSKNDNTPILTIKRKDMFDTALVNYVRKIIEMEYNNEYSHYNIKEVLAYTFVNASSYDLSNPVEYLNKRLNCYNEELDNNKKLESLLMVGNLEAKIKVEINKHTIKMEAPYSFDARKILS